MPGEDFDDFLRITEIYRRITEIYRPEGGRWKLVHRHADPVQDAD